MYSGFWNHFRAISYLFGYGKIGCFFLMIRRQSSRPGAQFQPHNTVLTAPVDLVRVTTRTMVGKYMTQTPSTVSSPGETCSNPLVPTVTTTPIGSTPSTGKPVSTFCVTNTPAIWVYVGALVPSGAIPHPLSSFTQNPVWSGFYSLPLSVITGATSTCVDTRVIYVNPTQLCATPLCSATLEGLCSLPFSLAIPVTCIVDGHMLGENFLPCKWHVSTLSRSSHARCKVWCLPWSVSTWWLTPSTTADGTQGGTMDPQWALCHHGDEVQDRLSECETVFRSSTTVATGITSTTTLTSTSRAGEAGQVIKGPSQVRATIRTV
jgi:hypothetical protein